jgi:hypothetical protein
MQAARLAVDAGYSPSACLGPSTPSKPVYRLERVTAANTTPPPPPLLSPRHHPVFAMAASLRPTLMRHALAAPAQRTLTSAVMPAFRVQRSQPIHKSIPRATFQTSAARHILPPLPQVIRGGMNDAAPTPAPHPAHGSYHWSFERCDIENREN